MWLFLKRWGELPRNGGVRATISIYFSYLEPMDGLFPLANYRVFYEGERAGALERHILTSPTLFISTSATIADT